MEKNSREVRRGGVVGKRHVSATRRSRASSGFKYSSGVGNEDGDEMVEKSPSPNPRLQENNNGNNKERSRKHQVGRMSSPSLQEASDYSCKDLDRERDRDRDRSHSKRKRLGLQESQNHQSSSVKDMDDNSDDNTEMGRSEDDDDLPPTTVPRRRWKLKLHGKPREDLSPIDPAPVPRKLRTAMTKRPQESSPHVHVADVPKQQRLSNDAAAAMSAPASSSVVSNPGRKKRLDNQKPPTAKLAKISSTKVSKTEVEVAETLFDLARMFTIHTMPSSPETKAEPILAAKSGSATTGTGPDMKRSPGASTADTASPSSSFAQSQPGVLKKKRPRMSLKTKEEGLTSVTGTSSSAEPALAEQAHCFQLEKGQSQVESRASPKAGTLVAPVIGSTAASPDVKADLEIPVSLEAKAIKMEASSPSMEIRSTSDPSEKLTISNSAGPVSVANKDSELAKDLVSRETTEKLELDNRPPELAPKDGGLNKYEIDLMASPQSIDKSDEILDADMPHAKEREQTLPDNQKGDGNLDSNKTNAKEKEQVDLADILLSEITPEDKERKNLENSINIEFDKENKQPIESSEHDECNDRKLEKDNGIVKERNDKTDALKDRSKQEIAKQTLKGTGNNAKPDPLAHRCDSNASAKVTTTSNVRSTSIPVSMAGWPAGFPHLGYYPMAAAAAAAAVAASWTTPLTMTGMSTTENNRVTSQLPSFFFPPQQARKRCATHVHITHLIDGYQKMKSNPLFAVAYANPTTIYGNGIMGTPVSSTLEPGIRPSDLAVGPLKEKEPAGGAPDAANVHGSKEKANSSVVDTSEIKSSQKQTQTGQKNTSVTIQNDPVLGLPVNISAAASVSVASTGTSNTAGSNVLVTAAMFSGGSSASSCNSSITSTGNGLQDGSVATAAVLQSQLLNSAIQQPFPFSISSGHFGSPYSGHLVQQVPQFYGSPFYETHMVSQQLATTTSPSAPQKQPKNSQGSFPSGASQPQHQETSQASLASSGVASQPPKHPNEKSIMMDSRSAKKQVPIVQRTIYGQNFSQAGVPALPIHSQDFSQNFGGKQTGKIKQQAQVQVLPQQQLTAQVQKQQKAYVATQYHAPAPAVQTELKDFDSKVSQSSLNRGPVNPDLAGLPGVASIMTSQGELLQNMVDLPRGHNQFHKTIQNQMSVGQSHQYSISGGHDQKMHQRQHPLMERVVANNAGESGRITNEGIYGKVGLDETRKESIKYEMDQPSYFHWDSSRNMQGSQTNTDPKRGSTVNSTVITFSEGTAGQAVTVGKLTTGQGIHFPGQIGGLASQGLRRSHAMQDSAQPKTSTITSVGSLLVPAGGALPQAMQGAMSKSEGQQPRSEQLTMNSGSRITPAPSISSSPVATSPLPSLQSVSKSGVGATTKNTASVKDSHSSLQKSTLASTSSKGISTTNMASVLGPGQPSTTLQVQLNQNPYSIQQQQHHQHLRHQQTVQFMDSAQKHHGQPVLQNYPLNQNYSQQTNKHPSSQQQHLQFGQHILIHPPIQYEVGIQSQVHSQPLSQSPTLHQQTLQQLQQLGSIQQQHIKHLQPVLTTPFGNLSHNIGTIDAGNASLSIVSDGVTTTAKSTGEINKPCSGSKTSRNDGSVHGHNGVIASLQHVSSSNTVSVSYPNSVLQSMPSSGATAEKLSEKTNQ